MHRTDDNGFIDRADPFESDEAYEEFSVIRDQLQNLTLLERTLNAELEDKPFEDKVQTYGQSAFALTRELQKHDEWTFTEANARADTLAGLAVKAWPR